MEVKKNKKYDLEHKRPLFFSIGMIISLSLALVAFEWKSPIDPIMELNPEYEEFTPLVIPPITHTPPPPPPPKAPIIQSTIEEPEEEIEVPIDVEITDDEPVVILLPTEMPDEKADKAPINWAEVMPTFEGGMENFYKFLGKNIRYPKQAQRMGVEGRVVVQFVVEKDGSLTDLQVLKGIGAGCDEEAIRVMKKVPNFLPGKQGDVRVRVQMVVPINFTLQ
ncbi:energy transducer TonB [Ekhidna sp. To15]|uniref:energy transducer TonB n=1 Tax=Ekhidna sp. To15 TaxID=3395267 RepID=UPI003F521DBC